MAVTVFSWGTPAAVATALTNPVPANGSTALSAAIDNSTTGALYVDFFYIFASAATGAGAPYVGLWLLSSVDGTAFEDPQAAGTALSPRPLDVIFPLLASVTQAQNVNAMNIPAPPYQFKVLLYNQAGVTLVTGGSVKYRFHNEIGT